MDGNGLSSNANPFLSPGSKSDVENPFVSHTAAIRQTNFYQEDEVQNKTKESVSEVMIINPFLPIKKNFATLDCDNSSQSLGLWQSKSNDNPFLGSNTNKSLFTKNKEGTNPFKKKAYIDLPLKSSGIKSRLGVKKTIKEGMI